MTAIPSIVASLIYAAGDAVGGLVAFTTDVTGRALPKRGVLQGMKVIDTALVALALTEHAYTASFTPTADNAPLATPAAGGLGWFTSVPFSVAVSLGGVNAREVNDIDSPYYSSAGAIYMQAQTGGTPTIPSGAVIQIQAFILPFAENIPQP